MTLSFKHREIHKYIVSLIESPSARLGDKLPTDTQLSRLFNVSRPTVTRAMQDLVTSGIVERKIGAGTFIVKREKKDKKLIGLLISGLGETEIFGPICSEIATLSPMRNFNLLWSDVPLTDNEPLDKQEILHCKYYIDAGVSGIFWAPSEHSEKSKEVNQEIAEVLSSTGIAVIMLDRDYVAYPQKSNFDLVGIDNHRAGYTQAALLFSNGVKKIVYLARKDSAITVKQRIMGVHAAKIEWGVNHKDCKIIFGDPNNDEIIKDILDFSPEAVICANDITAGTLMWKLLNCNIRIPQDIRVVGLDDVRYSKLFSVPLTTLNQPCRAIGSFAVAAMERRIADSKATPSNTCMDFTLKIRESCGTRKKN
ncbi:MAG: substrate-binding domain-containing protein [Thermoguttaceae bacterium]